MLSVVFAVLYSVTYIVGHGSVTCCLHPKLHLPLVSVSEQCCKLYRSVLSSVVQRIALYSALGLCVCTPLCLIDFQFLPPTDKIWGNNGSVMAEGKPCKKVVRARFYKV